MDFIDKKRCWEKDEKLKIYGIYFFPQPIQSMFQKI